MTVPINNHDIFNEQRKKNPQSQTPHADANHEYVSKDNTRVVKARTPKPATPDQANTIRESLGFEMEDVDMGYGEAGMEFDVEAEKQFIADSKKARRRNK